jgi:type II secretory pathway component GspD/PulD (secretin)
MYFVQLRIAGTGTPPAGTPPTGTPATPDGSTPAAKPVESKPASKRYIPPIRALDPKKKSEGGEAAEVVITVQQGGLVIASQDTESARRGGKPPDDAQRAGCSEHEEFTVFYLKFVPAAVAAALVQEVLGAAEIRAAGEAVAAVAACWAISRPECSATWAVGCWEACWVAEAAVAAAVRVAGRSRSRPMSRLNALFVRASATDLEMVEELLRIIDREASPEDVQTNAPPRFILVFNTSADEVAAVVKQVYANRLVADAGGQQRQPSPEEFLRALRGGGRGGQGGGKQEVKSEPAKITVGVDARSNSLIVSAPEPLFLEMQGVGGTT